MIEVLAQYIKQEQSLEGKINRLREWLQLLTLKIIQDSGYFVNITFVGGTALRVVYDLRRFSEDLDFSLITKQGYDFSKIIEKLEHEFSLSNIDLETKSKLDKTVHNSMLKFPNLMKRLGISNLASQKLSIKLEIDSNPPAGWELETSVINKVYLLNISHLSLASLYATKLHACFFRKYAKGRDFYDLIWYLGRKLQPNYILLNNAIKQTQGNDLNLSSKNIADFLIDRLSKVDFAVIKKDVERFLEDRNELELLSREIISKAVVDVFK